MNLIKAGTEYFDLDSVKRARFLENGTLLIWLISNHPNTPDIFLRGRQARIIQDLLNEQANDLTELTDEELERA